MTTQGRNHGILAALLLLLKILPLIGGVIWVWVQVEHRLTRLETRIEQNERSIEDLWRQWYTRP